MAAIRFQCSVSDVQQGFSAHYMAKQRLLLSKTSVASTKDVNISHRNRTVLINLLVKVLCNYKVKNWSKNVQKLQRYVTETTTYLESTFRCRWTFRNQRTEWWGRNNDTANVKSCQHCTST